MKIVKTLNSLLANKNKFLLLSCAFLAATFTWINVFAISIPPAIADDNIAAEAVDQVFGEGTSDKIEGKAQEDIGTAKKKAGEMSGQTDGAIDQIQGKAKEDIGTVKRNIAEMTGQTEGTIDQAQGQAKQAMGEAKNRLDKAGDDAQEASGNIVDSVKDLFGR